MIIKNKGLVINSIDYQDNAVISLILTEDGLKNYIIKGAKKYTTSTHALSQPLTFISFNQTDKEKLPLITEGKVLNNYTTLKDDLLVFQSLMIIFDKIKFFNESINDIKVLNKFIYDLLDIFIKYQNHLEKIKIVKSLIAIFETKLLYLLGVQPSFKICGRCDKNINLVGFNIKLGSAICYNCINSSDENDTDLINRFKELYYKKLLDFTEDDLVNNYSKIRLWNLIDDYYEYHLEYKNKIKTVFTTIFLESEN